MGGRLGASNAMKHSGLVVYRIQTLAISQVKPLLCVHYNAAATETDYVVQMAMTLLARMPQPTLLLGLLMRDKAENSWEHSQEDSVWVFDNMKPRPVLQVRREEEAEAAAAAAATRLDQAGLFCKERVFTPVSVTVNREP